MFNEQGAEVHFLPAPVPTRERMTAVLAQVATAPGAEDDDQGLDPALATCVQSKPDRYPLFGLSLFASRDWRQPGTTAKRGAGRRAPARAPGLLSPLSPGKNLASNVSAWLP